MYQTILFGRKLAILIAGGISVHLLVEIVSTLHVLTSFGCSHNNCTVRFSASTVFVRPSIFACSCFRISPSSCTVRLFAFSVFVWPSMVACSSFSFSTSSCTVRLSCPSVSLQFCRTASFLSSCFFILLITPSDSFSLDLKSSSSNFSDLKAASEI